MKVIVESNTVYVLGIQNNTGSNSDYFFWKNNVRYNLKTYLSVSPTFRLVIKDFVVKNNVELFAGLVDDVNTPSSFAGDVSYWKNGVKTVLQLNQSLYNKISIDTYNNDIYVSPGGSGGYFKNNTFVNTGSASSQNFAQTNNNIHFLYIHNNNHKLIYYNTINNIVSYENAFNYPNMTDCKLIADPSTNNLYAFSEVLESVYYKNNQQITVNDPLYRFIVDMKVLDDNIYMIREISPFSTAPINYKVFINNVETQAITGNIGSFNSVFVVRN